MVGCDSYNGNVETCFYKHFEFLLVEFSMYCESPWKMRRVTLSIKYSTSSLVLNYWWPCHGPFHLTLIRPSLIGGWIEADLDVLELTDFNIIFSFTEYTVFFGGLLLTKLLGKNFITFQIMGHWDGFGILRKFPFENSPWINNLTDL